MGSVYPCKAREEGNFLARGPAGAEIGQLGTQWAIFGWISSGPVVRVGLNSFWGRDSLAVGSSMALRGPKCWLGRGWDQVEAGYGHWNQWLLGQDGRAQGQVLLLGE